MLDDIVEPLVDKPLIYWFGIGVEKLPAPFKEKINTWFTVENLGSDIAQLTRPDISLVFVYAHGLSFHSLLQSSLTICANLRKQIVILHDGLGASVQRPLPCVLHSIDVMNSDNLIALDKVYRFISDYQDTQISHSFAAAADSDEHHSDLDLSRVLNFIHDNLTKRITIDQAAELMNYSSCYFSKYFHRRVGISFQDYVIEKRIELAKELLQRNQEMKISSVAFRCGYNDVSYFSRIFKKRTGMTPQQYQADKKKPLITG